MSFRVAMEYLQFIFHLQLFQEPKNTLRARLFKPFIEIVNLSCTAQEDSNKIYQYKITFGFSVEAAGVDAMVCASVYTIGRYVGYVQIWFTKEEDLFYSQDWNHMKAIVNEATKYEFLRHDESDGRGCLKPPIPTGWIHISRASRFSCRMLSDKLLFHRVLAASWTSCSEAPEPKPSFQSTAASTTLIMAGHHNHRKLVHEPINYSKLTLFCSDRPWPGVSQIQQYAQFHIPPTIAASTFS